MRTGTMHMWPGQDINTHSTAILKVILPFSYLQVYNS